MILKHLSDWTLHWGQTEKNVQCLQCLPLQSIHICTFLISFSSCARPLFCWKSVCDKYTRINLNIYIFNILYIYKYIFVCRSMDIYQDHIPVLSWALNEWSLSSLWTKPGVFIKQFGHIRLYKEGKMLQHFFHSGFSLLENWAHSLGIYSGFQTKSVWKAFESV